MMMPVTPSRRSRAIGASFGAHPPRERPPAARDMPKKRTRFFRNATKDSARLTAPAPRSAALVSQEHAHRLSGQSNHVVSAFDRRRRSNKQMSPSDWAHRLPEAETGCLLLAPET